MPNKNASHAVGHERRKRLRGSTLVYHSSPAITQAMRRASTSLALPDALSAPLGRTAFSRWPSLSWQSPDAYSFRSTRYSVASYTTSISPPCQVLLPCCASHCCLYLPHSPPTKTSAGFTSNTLQRDVFPRILLSSKENLQSLQTKSLLVILTVERASDSIRSRIFLYISSTPSPQLSFIPNSIVPSFSFHWLSA